MNDSPTPLVDQPVAGLYKARLVRGGPWIVIEIWKGFGTDPETGETLERGWQWRATRDGRPCGVFDVWPGCSGRRIEQDEADRLTGRKADPDAPERFPRSPVDLGKMKPIF